MTLGKAVARSGIVDAPMLAEFRHWGLPVQIPDGAPLDGPRSAIEAIQEALESEELVIVRETELDILKQYFATQKKGRLHLATGEQSGELEVTFGRGRQPGEFIIPWKADSLEDLLTNGRSHLLEGRRKIYFSTVREVYYGEVKAFMVCQQTVKGSDAGKSS